MKKTVTTIAVLLFLLIDITAQAQDTQYEVQSFDTLFHTQVGAGAFYTEYENPEVPLKIQVVQFDINQSGLEIRTVAANNLLAGGYQKTSEMRHELEDENTFVVAGVNGDFYAASGRPTNVQIVDGEMLRIPISRDIIAFDDAFKPIITNGTSFSGEVTGEGFSAPVNNINASRGADQIVAYNSFMGSSTGTNAFGTEIALKQLEEVLVNRPAQYEITRIEKNVGNMSLNDDDLILSANGSAISNFEGLEVGDVLSVQINLNPIEQAILEAVGGNGQFLVDGEVIETWAEWHPRTAVGFDADTTTGYFMVVDGRQNTSRGMTTGQMGIFLKSVGAANAINLDGGGSSTMLVQSEVMNNPSDGVERNVANALFVTLPFSDDGEIQRIKLRAGASKVFIGKTTQVKTLSFDQYHKFSHVSSDEVEFSADGHIGEISADGVFTASMESGTGYVYANFGDFRDSTSIKIVGAANISLSPAFVNLDTTMTFSPDYTITDNNGFNQSVSRQNISWSLTNSAIGQIDDNGVFTAASAGETGIIAEFSTVSDTMQVVVTANEGYVVLDDFKDIDSWMIEASNLDAENFSVSALDNNEGLQIAYTIPANTSDVRFTMEKELPIEGVPGFANIVYSGSGDNFLISIDIANLNDGIFQMAPTGYLTATEPAVVHYKFDENSVSRVTPGAVFYYPFAIQTLNLRIPDNPSDDPVEGYFRFNELGVSYTEIPVSNELEDPAGIPDVIELHQNYPNPFNPVTSISFKIPTAGNVELDVFDLLGRKVTTLIDGRVQAGSHSYNFDASELSSGIYLYRLKTENTSLTRKMTLIK